MITAPCPSRHDLSDYASGKLPDNLSDSIAEHLSLCKACQETLLACDDATDSLIASLRMPQAEDPYTQEPGCGEAIAIVEAIGREPSINMRRGVAGAPTPPEDPRVVGQYELLAKLGAGGMGTVYKALHTRLDKIVALKVLPRDRTRDSSAVARFAREMKAVGRLDHPHIVRAMDANEHDGTHYLVMEYVEGWDLGELIRRRDSLVVADACELVRQAALGLQYAHEHGLVHRDIKPSNLMLTRQGQVKILDLGLALLRADELPNREMTGDGQMMGTADFMAPEQATDAHSVDIRADVYSLGCTLFKLLTGHAPFAAPAKKKPLEVVLAHLQQTFPSVRDARPEVPVELASILARMTAKDPGDRFATPAEVATALAPFAAAGNLPRLADELAEPVACSTILESSRTNTDDYVSSALTDTTPSSLSPLAETATLLPVADRGSGRRRFCIALAAAAAVLPICFGIWIIVRDREGREVGRMQIPAGGSAAVVDEQGNPVVDSKLSAEPPTTLHAGKTPERSHETPVSIDLTPEPLDVPAGAPLSKMALVGQPVAIPGVRSWTIETIGHRGVYTQAAYSPDGRLLATSCSDETIRLWDAATGRFIRAIVAHDDSIVGFDWSADGKLLATASRDGTIRFWAPETGLRLATLRAERSLTSFAWSPDRRLIAAGLAGTGLQIWDFATGDARQPQTRRGSWRRVAPGVSTTVCGTEVGVGNLSWCCDNRKLICGCTQASVCLFDVETKEWRYFPVALGLGFIGAAVSPDGKIAAFPGNPIQLWDLETNQIVREFANNAEARSRMAWSADGQSLAGGCWGWVPAAAIWDPESGKEHSRSETTDVGSPTSLAFSPDGQSVAAGMGLGRVQVFESASGLCQFVLPAHLASWDSVSWSPDARSLVCAVVFATDYQPARVLNSASGNTVRESTSKGVWGSVLSWSPDHDMITLNIGRAPGIWRLAADAEWAIPTRLDAASVTWAPDGKTLCAAEGTGKAEIWNVRESTPNLVAALNVEVKTAAFAPDGKGLAIGWRNELKLCDAGTGEVRENLAVVPAPVSLMAWSPDGKILAVACDDMTVHIIDMTSKQIVAKCDGHKESIVSLGWADGGKTLISGSAHSVRVWEAESGKLVRTIADDGGAISADGRLIASRGQSAIRIWQTQDGNLARTIVSLRDRQFAAVSPDGHFNGSPDVEREFVYVVQTDAGQETLTPDEFATKYGWTNDPSKIALELTSAASVEGGQ